jgi:hypothetical protein
MAVNRLQSDQHMPSASRSTPAPRRDSPATAKYGHKLLFPTFDGTEDPLPWLNRCDQLFKIQETPEDGKVFLTSYMTGAASQWYTLCERNHDQLSWAEFVKLVNQRFGTPLRSNPLDELIQLRREGSVAEYQNAFLALHIRC